MKLNAVLLFLSLSFLIISCHPGYKDHTSSGDPDTGPQPADYNADCRKICENAMNWRACMDSCNYSGSNESTDCRSICANKTNPERCMEKCRTY